MAITLKPPALLQVKNLILDIFLHLVFYRLISLQKSRLRVRHRCIDLLLSSYPAKWPAIWILASLAVDLYFCLLRRSTGQPTGHKTGMNETAVACLLALECRRTPSWKTLHFHGCHVIYDVIWKGLCILARCWQWAFTSIAWCVLCPGCVLFH